MPAVFGGSGSAGEFRAFPFRWFAAHVVADTSPIFPTGAAGEQPILTAIDVVSFGGGAGGFATFLDSHTNTRFWSINIGGSVDTFSWRGFLVFPFDAHIEISNTSDTDLEVIACGVRSIGWADLG